MLTLVILFLVLFIYGTTFANEYKYACLAAMLFPALDVISDFIYLISNTFFRESVFWLCLAFFVSSNSIFVYELIKTGSRPRDSYVITALQWHKFQFAVFLGHENGFPTVYGKVSQYVFTTNDNILKLVSFYIVWAIYVVIQIAVLIAQLVQLFLMAMLTAIFDPFIVFWLLAGFYLFQTKLLSIRPIWNYWFKVWTGTDKFDKKNMIDFHLLNESFLAEFLLETTPQLILQSYNNTMIKSWSNVAYFSVALSLLMAINGIYRYGYYLLYKGLKFDEIPIEISLGGIYTIRFDDEDISSNKNNSHYQHQSDDSNHDSNKIKSTIRLAEIELENSNKNIECVDEEVISPIPTKI